jgi:hypothetical protein
MHRSETYNNRFFISKYTLRPSVFSLHAQDEILLFFTTVYYRLCSHDPLLLYCQHQSHCKNQLLHLVKIQLHITSITVFNHARSVHTLVVVPLRYRRLSDDSVNSHHSSCLHASCLLHFAPDQCHHHSHGCSSSQAMRTYQQLPFAAHIHHWQHF